MEARRLRLAGMPFKRIATELGVSPSSVFVWTQDIQLSAAQNSENLRGPRGPLNAERLRKQAAAWAETCRASRRECQNEGRVDARREKPLHMAGCMLYWAEGTKSRNALVFANSDRSMMVFFRRFLTEALGVPVSAIRMRLNVYTAMECPWPRWSRTSSACWNCRPPQPAST